MLTTIASVGDLGMRAAVVVIGRCWWHSVEFIVHWSSVGDGDGTDTVGIEQIECIEVSGWIVESSGVSSIVEIAIILTSCGVRAVMLL